MAEFQNPALEDMRGEHNTSSIKMCPFTKQAMPADARGLAKIIGNVSCMREVGAEPCTHALSSDSSRGAVPSPAVSGVGKGSTQTGLLHSL